MRYHIRLFAFVGVLLVCSVFTPSARAISVWTPGPALPRAYEHPNSVRLSNGQVLLAGGWNSDSMALYDPASDRWTDLPPAGGSTPFQVGPLVALRDGTALLIGGVIRNNPHGVLYLVARFDPATRTWSDVAPMKTARAGHSATLLPDGRVLVTGGRSVIDNPNMDFRETTAEIYDPATNQWTDAAPMHEQRAGHTATLLADGTVFVAGGDTYGTTERYDPATNQWTTTVPLLTRRTNHIATWLPNNTVLLLGGTNEDSTGEIYDPAANSFRPAPPLINQERTLFPGFTATLLPSGLVLVAGGYIHPPGAESLSVGTFLASTELYDWRTDRWVQGAPMSAPRTEHATVVLQSGQVLVIGGREGSKLLATTERYSEQTTPEQCFNETGKCVRGIFLDYWRQHGGLPINGYPLSDEFVQVLENGQAYTVQYFERVRMEYHPENQPPYNVLLGQFGRRLHPADPPVAPKRGARFFPETGHNVDGLFLSYWQRNGGLAQFGYPLSETFAEQLEDGQTYTVQYFERARFEYHPENRTPYDVLLGQFGRRMLSESQQK